MSSVAQVMVRITLGLAAAALVATPAFADVLPLARGDYVQAGTPCADAPFAALRTYDGRGIGSAHSRDCRARIVARRGARMTLANDCIDAGAGPAPRSVERLRVRLVSRTRLTLNGTAFRLCPAADRPDGARRH